MGRRMKIRERNGRNAEKRVKNKVMSPLYLFIESHVCTHIDFFLTM
jgi:hypothetical protein